MYYFEVFKGKLKKKNDVGLFVFLKEGMAGWKSYLSVNVRALAM